MQETWVRSLGRKGPLEEEMMIHSSILPWKNRWTEEPGGLQPMGLQRVGHNWAHTRTHVYIENPLFSGATFINELARSSGQLASASASALAASLYASILWKWLLSLDLVNKPLLTSNLFFCSFLTSHGLHRTEELGPCSGLGFGFRECCGCFDLLSRPLNLSLHQQ